jgi:hypothetical protein
MEVSGQLHAPVALLPRKEPPNTHQIGGWVGHRVSLNARIQAPTDTFHTSCLAMIYAELGEPSLNFQMDILPCSFVARLVADPYTTYHKVRYCIPTYISRYEINFGASQPVSIRFQKLLASFDLNRLRLAPYWRISIPLWCLPWPVICAMLNMERANTNPSQ